MLAKCWTCLSIVQEKVELRERMALEISQTKALLWIYIFLLPHAILSAKYLKNQIQM